MKTFLVLLINLGIVAVSVAILRFLVFPAIVTQELIVSIHGNNGVFIVVGICLVWSVITTAVIYFVTKRLVGRS